MSWALASTITSYIKFNNNHINSFGGAASAAESPKIGDPWNLTRLIRSYGERNNNEQQPKPFKSQFIAHNTTSQFTSYLRRRLAPARPRAVPRNQPAPDQKFQRAN